MSLKDSFLFGWRVYIRIWFGSAQFGFVYLWNRAYPRKYSNDINIEQNYDDDDDDMVGSMTI